ncbi:MAG: pyridoxal phosphate-dependent aminotransferase [Gammaproteobacteria bacterium]|nr:pyridoxal phosphate-dependent aminotransferase [Gammaproteobacteria bacterium]
MNELTLAARVERLGTESAFDVLMRANRLAAEGRDIVNLGIGQPDAKPPATAIEAARKALRDGDHGYTEPPGLPALREAVAADLDRRLGVDVAPDRVFVTPGAKPVMFFAMLMFGESGAEILYPDPGFPIYRSMIDFSGAGAIPYRLEESRGFSLDPESVLEQVTERTRLIILNSPANPTGGVTARKDMDRLVEGLLEHPQVAVLTDEIYDRIYFDERRPPSLLEYPEIRDRLIVLNGWSKTYAMTGWRLGYSVWPCELVDKVLRLAINCHSCVNTAAQMGGLAALEGPQDTVSAMVSEFASRRTRLVDRLNALSSFSCQPPGGAFYVFPNITSTGLSGRAFQDRLLAEEGVALIDGTSFGAAGEGFVRISFALDQPRIDEGMDRIARFVSNL